MKAAREVLQEAGRQLLAWRVDELVVLIAFVAVMAGCSQAPVVPERIEIPVPVACLTAAPKKPALKTDLELRQLNDFQLPIALATDRRMRQVYEAELEAALAGCWVPEMRPDGT